MSQDNDVLASRVDVFCEKLDISPVGENKKIDRSKAVYYKITDIRYAIHDILGGTKVRIEGRTLRDELIIGTHFLEEDGRKRGVETIYALTKEGARRILQSIEKREGKQTRRPI